jgi:hypothetical protein
LNPCADVIANGPSTDLLYALERWQYPARIFRGYREFRFPYAYAERPAVLKVMHAVADRLGPHQRTAEMVTMWAEMRGRKNPLDIAGLFDKV